MGLIEDGATDEQLQAEEQRLLALSMEMTTEGVALLNEAARFLAGPDADPERYSQLHADYMQAHEQHMKVHAEFVRVHQELQRRGH